MSTRSKPAWHILFVISLGGAAVLYIESLLPVDSQVHTWLLLVWIILFYGGVAVWMRSNSEALEHEPPALDGTGRPIIDDGLPTTRRSAIATQTRDRKYRPEVESRPLGYRHSEANRSV